MSVDNERWLPVVYKGESFIGYEVSNFGNIRSYWKIKRLGGGRGSIGVLGDPPMPMKATFDADGYRYLKLRKNGKKRHCKVCWLVLEAFVGPRPEGYQTCHGILGVGNDAIENLSWGTASKNNLADKLRDGKDSRGEKHLKAKITNDTALDIKRRLRDGEGPTKIAKSLGVSVGIVEQIKGGHNWKWLQLEGAA